MDLELLAPEISLAVTAVAVILLDLFIQRKGLLAIVSVIGLVVSAAFAIAMSGGMTLSATTAAHADDTIKCSGVNSCKGTSECATAANSCKGQNSCKGHGWISLTKSECDAKGGKPIES